MRSWNLDFSRYGKVLLNQKLQDIAPPQKKISLYTAKIFLILHTARLKLGRHHPIFGNCVNPKPLTKELRQIWTITQFDDVTYENNKGHVFKRTFWELTQQNRSIKQIAVEGFSVAH